MFEPARNIDDAWVALDLKPLKPGDKRYVDCSKVRGNTLAHIRRMLQRYNMAGKDLHLLFTGYRGNGKTTELYQLQSSINKNYEIIYFDAEKDLDINNLTLSDLLLAIAKETMDYMKKNAYDLPENLLEDVGEWFFEKVLEKSESIAREAGARSEVGIPAWVSFITGKVFAAIKMKTDDRETMRRNLERDITELIEKVNALLSCAREKVKQKRKIDLLFIMDSLDRLRAGLDKNLFMASGRLLQQLKGNFIYVVPISLLYDQQARLLPFDEDLVLPMIPIYKRGIARKINESGINYLEKIICRRLVPEEIVVRPKETIRHLILASGGHLRDLMRLTNYCCSQTDDKITPEHAELAINTLIEDYKKVIREDDYEHIVDVYQTQESTNIDANQQLIYNNVILVYRKSDGVEWKDVHPAVVRNNKFQKAIEAGKDVEQ